MRVGRVPYLRLAMAAAVLHTAVVSRAQELEPRAYSISPRGTNFLLLGFARTTGDVSFDPALPIEDATATLDTTVLGYVRAIGFAGRSASVRVLVPYLWGSVQGLVDGSFQQAHRSGMADPAFRFVINLHGAPAMSAAKFKHYKQKTNIGATAVVIAPFGQYDPARLLNTVPTDGRSSPKLVSRNAPGGGIWTCMRERGCLLPIGDLRRACAGRIRSALRKPP
jgi:hypothetical protein